MCFSVLLKQTKASKQTKKKKPQKFELLLHSCRIYKPIGTLTRLSLYKEAIAKSETLKPFRAVFLLGQC